MTSAAGCSSASTGGTAPGAGAGPRWGWRLPSTSCSFTAAQSGRRSRRTRPVRGWSLHSQPLRSKQTAPLCTADAKHVHHAGAQRKYIEGLDDVLVHARIQRNPPLGLLHVGRYHHHVSIGQVGILLDLAAYLAALHARHLGVEHDDLGPYLVDQVEGLQAIIRSEE